MPPRRYRIMPLLLLLPQMLMPFFVLNNMTDIPGRCSLFQTFFCFYLASLFYLGRVLMLIGNRITASEAIEGEKLVKALALKMNKLII